MKFCPNCGAQILITSNFCPSCGSDLSRYLAVYESDGRTDAVTEETTAIVQTQASPVVVQTETQQTPVYVTQPVVSAQAVVQPVNTVKTYTMPTYASTYDTGSNEYELILVSTGTCAWNVCNDLIEDLLGYTDAQADRLIRQAPVRIASGLNREQARVLAQAFTEYGAQVSVYLGNGYVDLGNNINTSIFNSDGSILTAALAVLATITAANRVRRYVTWNKPGFLSRIFRPLFHRAAPPPHVRRPVFEPAPARRRSAAPAPAPAPRVRPQPARRTSAQKRPSGGRPQGRNDGPGGRHR